MELTLKEAVNILEYVKDWNVQNDIIIMDLMEKFPEYIFTWDDLQKKFIGILITIE